MPPPPSPFDDPELHQQLRSLPDPKAPGPMAAIVLNRLRSQQTSRQDARWWLRPIMAWPTPARRMAFIGLTLLAAGVILSPGWLWTLWNDAAASNSSVGWIAMGVASVQIVDALLGSLGGLIAGIPAWVLLAGSAMAVLTYSMALGVGSWLYRHTGAQQS